MQTSVFAKEALVNDEVDNMVAAWHAVRPDLEVSPLQVFSRISRLARRLDRYRHEAFAVRGVGNWEFDVLSALRKSGSPFVMTAGELMQETLVSSGTMTNRLGRLQQRGLVKKVVDSKDRRVVNVFLTKLGCEVVDNVIAELLEREKFLLKDLSDGEKVQIEQLLRQLSLTFERL